MSNNTVHTEEYKGYTIKIEYDETSSESFFDMMDVFTRFACFHRRHNLGNCPEFKEPDDFIEFEKENPLIKLPLYMYGYGGITIKTSPFYDSWDSGQLGWIFVTLEQIRKEFNCKHVTQKIRQKAINLMLAEVGTYDSLLRGEVYGYIVKNQSNEETDSCWGFIGEYDYCLQEAKSIVDWNVKEQAKEEELLINRALSFAGL